ncbi:MAG TPA: hypothetical protein DD808_16100, partial [Halieaceae bacterium]|nr:hypothetical protein [Halieaceae bacterium]
ARTRFRHYLNLKRMQPRLQQLLVDFRWDRMDRVFADAIVAPAGLQQPAFAAGQFDGLGGSAGA